MPLKIVFLRPKAWSRQTRLLKHYYRRQGKRVLQVGGGEGAGSEGWAGKGIGKSIRTHLSTLPLIASCPLKKSVQAAGSHSTVVRRCSLTLLD